MKTINLLKIVIGTLLVIFGILDPYKNAFLINTLFVIFGIFVIFLGFKEKIRKYFAPIKKGFLNNLWPIFRG